MKYILLPALLLCSGCICFDRTHKELLKDRQDKPPITDTKDVKGRIDETKDEISKAEKSSQDISKSTDRAKNLTERVDKILEELDKQQK